MYQEYLDDQIHLYPVILIESQMLELFPLIDIRLCQNELYDKTVDSLINSVSRKIHDHDYKYTPHKALWHVRA